MSTETDTQCIQAQFDELEAVQSIYGSAWKADSESAGCYGIDIKENDINVSLYLTLPETYPFYAPPGYILSSSQLTMNQKNELKALLEEEYLANVGSGIIYQWIEKVRDFILNLSAAPPEAVRDEVVYDHAEDCELPAITHGEIIIDRKSTFQGHLARVYSVDQVKQVLSSLKKVKKIAHATHNMYAYRIQIGDSSFIQDCDDDGETQAGSRMLHLLQILNVSNLLVVVSRWYGGVHLGPDRFRHINQATRQVIEQAGLLPNKKN